MECPHCQNQTIVKNGKDYHQDGKAIQNYGCKGCGKRFNERTGTPANLVSLVLKRRSEGMGIRASGKVLESPMQVSWDGSKKWQPSHSLPRADIPVEGDEGYTRLGEKLPSDSTGWTIHRT